MNVIASPGKNASRRTQNRFSEHDLSKVEEIRSGLTVLSNTVVDGALMRCDTPNCGWLGWIPLTELMIRD